MIDTHCHILPDFDDGPSDIAESIEMARIAAADGVRAIVATPHVGNGVYDPSPGDIQSAVERLNRRLIEEKIPLEVFPGAEVHLSPGLPEAAQNRRLMTFNNGFRYLLLELPGFGIPSEIVDFIWKIKISGIIPVLAHPERNETLQANIDLIQRMVQQEALVQITAASLEGNFGRRTKRCAETLLARNLVHLIASDAHSAKGGRPPILSRARFLAADLTTPQKAGQMVKATPEKILNGETIRFEEPIIEKPRKKSFFNFF